MARSEPFCQGLALGELHREGEPPSEPILMPSLNQALVLCHS